MQQSVSLLFFIWVFFFLKKKTNCVGLKIKKKDCQFVCISVDKQTQRNSEVILRNNECSYHFRTYDPSLSFSHWYSFSDCNIQCTSVEMIRMSPEHWWKVMIVIAVIAAVCGLCCSAICVRCLRKWRLRQSLNQSNHSMLQSNSIIDFDSMEDFNDASNI